MGINIKSIPIPPVFDTFSVLLSLLRAFALLLNKIKGQSGQLRIMLGSCLFLLFKKIKSCLDMVAEQ